MQKFTKIINRNSLDHVLLPICLEYEFDMWQILTYCTFKLVANCNLTTRCCQFLQTGPLTSSSMLQDLCTYLFSSLNSTAHWKDSVNQFPMTRSSSLGRTRIFYPCVLKNVLYTLYFLIDQTDSRTVSALSILHYPQVTDLHLQLFTEASSLSLHASGLTEESISVARKATASWPLAELDFEFDNHTRSLWSLRAYLLAERRYSVHSCVAFLCFQLFSVIVRNNRTDHNVYTNLWVENPEFTDGFIVFF